MEFDAMGTPFLGSEEYDERAHQLYNEARYDEALEVLREGLRIYPNAVELHIGVGYAHLAREDYGWAKRGFESALVLDPEHEDALAGLGETLLRFNNRDAALKCFRRVLDLGYEDDIDLMLQCGRALFREGLITEAREFFEVAKTQAPESAEATALIAYCHHRLGDDARAITLLRRALELDTEHAEARIYLANVLYDAGRLDDAFALLDATEPDDHWDELGIHRYLELLAARRSAPSNDPTLRAWRDRLAEMQAEPDPIDAMLDEIEQRAAHDEERAARGQLELFGALLEGYANRGPEPRHRVELQDGRVFEGTWDEIVHQMRVARDDAADRSAQEFMQAEARRTSAQTGVPISADDAESFIRGNADAGILRILA